MAQLPSDRSSDPPLQSYPHLTSLLFPNNQQPNINKILTTLKRNNLSLTNRLHSIHNDATFVLSVASAYNLPLVANERCGSWYIPPERKVESAYFKSTDGHMAQWGFSLRRLNLQVLELCGGFDGCIIVDSTRRGKSMPDALSKTIPIWATVLNRLLFPEQAEFHEATTPPTVVGASEHAQIASRIPGFVESLKTLNLDLDAVRKKVSKPLKPIWVTPLSSLPETPPAYSEFHPLILLTASSRISSESTSETGYIQGAADDAEAWACGLTAPLFWKHCDVLLNTPEDELEGLIADLLARDDGVKGAELTGVGTGKRVWIGTTEAAEAEAKEDDVVVTASPKESSILRSRCKSRYLHFPLAEGKIGSRNLRHSLPTILTFLPPFLTSTPPPRIVVADTNGKDQGVGIALAILCLFVTDGGELRAAEGERNFRDGLNKTIVKQKLSWISVARPDANPSRTTLQSVNAFLLG